MPKCDITGIEYLENDLLKGKYLRPKLFDLIKSEYPQFDQESNISYPELKKYRKKYLEILLKEELGELSVIEKEVIKSIQENEVLTSNIEPDIARQATFGERTADKIAEFGGSWTFIILFFSFLLLWIGINVFSLLKNVFDPYPFILLNLILSTVAAIQAPIIMMSQNRKETKDRSRSEHDYKINLKAELEIRLLHEKIDHLLVQQNQRLLEIQQMQLDLMEDILNKIK